MISSDKIKQVSDSSKENGTSNTKKIRLAIVGDVHNCWDPVADETALKFLDVDVCLFVGDIGNENVKIVGEIANLDHPKAIILGNHDMWRTRKLKQFQKQDNGLRQQLERLGDLHLGYASMSFPHLKLTVVGARPFSWGGKWERLQAHEVLNHLYGVQTQEDSVAKIVETVESVPADHTIVMIAHNGPKGLGRAGYDICGADFLGAGDHGDEDLQLALEQLRTKNRMPTLLAFGHMHESLAFAGSRRMIRMDQNERTTYLNTAVVPRVAYGKGQDTRRHFCVVEIVDGSIASVENQWVNVGSDGVAKEITQRQPLYRIDDNGYQHLFDGKYQKWRHTVLDYSLIQTTNEDIMFWDDGDDMDVDN
eukprot:TRINITY_DN5615_c1_g2_i1.p3 TRINITY_DN5615_c1_g2~~TRINITY_DN5615_c1_g2_i1.p3  ORF type:complete len:390 (-),score=42.85 TRINITY_DN5615_c1_g2_i1:672-1763(-)